MTRDSTQGDMFVPNDRASRLSMLLQESEATYTTAVRSHAQAAVEQKVNWSALKGDKGFKAGLVLNRSALNGAKTLVDEISVPGTELQWRERLEPPIYRQLRLRKMERPNTGKYCDFGNVS